ncbi:MAG: SDR family oxidoreductase [Acidimicrobiia bacterium]|nr:SDR family oxidoreductase [Acidimicrobiia bacterium]
MDLGLRGRRAAVAAASRGLGYACAAALAAEGARVALCARDRAGVDAAAARLGDGAVPIVADVSTPEGAAAFAEAAEAALGGVDILVTNAGGPPRGTVGEITDLHAYADAFALNALSAIAMCQVVLPGMRARTWGRIVAITSITVRQPAPDLVLSNPARAGLTGYLKTLAREVAADGVTVNSLQPGLHLTERLAGLGIDPAAAGAQIPAGFVGDPADFGAVAAFLCSDAARYLTGVALPVDGGVAAGLQ